MKKTYPELTYVITTSPNGAQSSVVQPGTTLHTNSTVEEFDTEAAWTARVAELGLTPPQAPEPPAPAQRTPEARETRRTTRVQREEQELAQRKAQASMSPLENRIAKLNALPKSDKVGRELQKATQKLQAKAAKATPVAVPEPAPKAPAKRSKKKSV